MSFIGLVKLEAGLCQSVVSPNVKKPKPKDNTTNDAIKCPVSKAVKRMQEYKVKQKDVS